MPKKGYKQTEVHKIKRRKFTDTQEKEIERQYREEKVSIYTLTKKWDCSITLIRKAVIKNGGKLRPLGEHRRGKIPWNKNIPLSEERKRKLCAFTKEEELKICSEYFSEKKPSCNTLAKKYNCSGTAIKKALIRNGYVLRTLSESHKGNKNAIGFRSKESKQKMSESNLVRIQNHPGPYKNTKPELAMKKLLNELNIPFIHQFRVKGINHNFDFHISNTNILIEVDGDYYHGNPKKFIKLSEIQIQWKQRDEKINKLAKTNNYILLRFWASDILHNEENVVESLKGLING